MASSVLKCLSSKVPSARPISLFRSSTVSSSSIFSQRCFSASAPRAAPHWEGTTILSVRKNGKVVIIGDGQVTQGDVVMKPNARKVRRLGTGVITAFAGATADAMTLYERLESKLEEYPGQLTRACVELAKQWRTDKYLRKLEAVMIVADANVSLTLTGNGDVLEPVDGVIGLGSGGNYALAAARALMDIPEMSAEHVARKAMTIASEMCIYTNANFTMESMDIEQPSATLAEPAPAPAPSS